MATGRADPGRVSVPDAMRLTRAHSTGCRLPGSPESQLRGGGGAWSIEETRYTRHSMMVTRATLRARGDVKLPPQQGRVVTRGGSLTELM